MREESWGQILPFLFTLLLCEVTLGMADLKKKKAHLLKKTESDSMNNKLSWKAVGTTHSFLK